MRKVRDKRQAERRLAYLIVSGALLMTMLACGGTATPTATPTERPPLSEPPPLTGAPVSITLVNESSVSACSAYVSPTTSDTWGENLLSSQPLPSGSRRTFELAPGNYDLLARDCDDNILDNQWNITIGSSYVWTLPTLRRIELTLSNRSDSQICYVYISPTTSDNWGSNWLGPTEVIRNGESRVFMIPIGQYDLRADDCDHAPLYEEFGFDIREAYRWEVTR